MNWFRRLFGRRDERQAKDVQLDRLEARAEATVKRADKVLVEQRKLTIALRNTTKAIRAEHRR